MADSSKPRVVLGVTGSIAAFRAADLASSMVREGWEVHAVLTADGARFLPALTLAALTHRPVHTSLWEEGEVGRMGHLDLAGKADGVVVAPASADCLARAAHGLAGDVLGAVLVATRAPIFYVPAMNTHMWEHAATQENVQTLKRRGARIIGPAVGRLACGAEGPGRMASVDEIMQALRQTLKPAAPRRKTK